MLAQDKNQRIIQMRCVLHGDLPGKSVSQGSILTSQGNRVEHPSLLSVKQGLTLSRSNGLVEGHMNRLKLLKRQGYGRADVALLRQRVMQAV